MPLGSVRPPRGLPRVAPRPASSAGRLRPRAWARVPTLLAAAAVLLTASGSRAQDEFLVNDDRVARNQWAPRAALGAGGTMLVAWMDGRNGSSIVDYDIYLMTLRDPRALGSSLNRRVNGDGLGPTQGFPDIAGSPAGTFLCVWEDGRAGNRDVYASVLDSIGQPIGPNLRVNDDVGTHDQALPRVAALGADRYLVVWGDGREGQGEIFASYRTAAGGPLGANRRISVDPVEGGSYQGEPAVAIDASGRALVVWVDSREGAGAPGTTFDVYGQWLDPDGTPIGGNFKVNDTSGPQRCASPATAADPEAGFVVAWIDRRNAPADPGDVYAQRFDPGRAPLGSNVRVNDDLPGRDQRSVRAAAGPGAAALVWEDLRGNLGIDSNVEAAMIPYDAGPPGANFRVNEEIGARQGTPSVVADGTGAFLAVWEDARHGAPDVFARSFLPDGTKGVVEAQLNDDAAPFEQRRPRLGHGVGRYVATWTDLRSQTLDLYAQWITAAGAREGVNHLLVRDDLGTRAVASSSAVPGSGRALVVAQVARFSDAGEIRGFLYEVPGAPPSRSFWISDDLPSAQALPAAAAADSEYAVVWIDAREGAPRLYGQRLARDGTRLGVNRPVLAVEPADPVHALDLEVAPSGGYWLCYAEGAGADQRVWLVALSPDLSPETDPLPVAPQLPGGRSALSVGVAADGRVEVAWLGTGANGYGRVYHAAFTPGFTALVTEGIGADPDRPQAAPSIAVSGASSVLVWGEWGPLGDWSVWLQRFQEGASAEAALRVDQDLTGSEQLDPSAGLDGAGHALVLWSDARSVASRTDILGRSLQFETTSAEEPPAEPEPPPLAAPRAMRVGPARPNPFSSTTALPLEVPAEAARASVHVWNVRGERVATLHEGAVPSGRIALRWDGRGRDGNPVASGVYWITVESGGARRATRVVHLR